MAAQLVTAMAARAQEGAPLPSASVEVLRRVGGLDAPEYAAFADEPTLVVDQGHVVFARIPREGRVSVFDSAGAFVRSIGRTGKGPGEFTIAAGHGLLGDTLWISDWPLPRMSIFDQEGRHVRTWTSEADIGRPFPIPLGITALLRDGRAVLVPDGTPSGAKSRLKLPVVLGGRDLTGGDTVAFVVRPQSMFLPAVGTFRLEPFPQPPLVAIAGDGSGLVIANWSEDAPDLVEVRRVHADGTTMWRNSVRLSTREANDAVRDSLIARGEQMARPQVEAAKRAGRLPPGASVRTLVRNGLYIPARQPAIRRIVPGLDGTVWLERLSPGPSPTWIVLGTSGEPTFRVTLPEHMTLQQVDGDRLWATGLSSDDVPFIVWLQITRPGGPSGQVSEPAPVDVSERLLSTRRRGQSARSGCRRSASRARSIRPM